MAWSLLFLVLFLLGALQLAAWYSRGQLPPSGLVEGRLRACPETPNCVCSEPGGAPGAQRIAPLDFGTVGAAAAWRALQQAVGEAGGVLRVSDDGYLAATFRTRWLGFSDDLEARFDPAAAVLHLRSASRVGHSDFGANRRRVERLARRYAELLQQGGSGG
ncbi:MAG TPA: DUF1499 domain-containing protein [Gammaproteobacteria bacterium]